MSAVCSFPALLEAFFTDRLMAQRKSSSQTIAAYRDAFRLLLQYVQKRLRIAPSCVQLTDLDAPLICSFLSYLEQERGNKVRTRNLRLAAIRSFFRYAAFQDPAHAAHIQRVLAIPTKRWARPLINYLSKTEANALVHAPDGRTWSGQRDQALLMLALQSGFRVSELVALRCDDVKLGPGAHVCCLGKGRKLRAIPLTTQTAMVLRSWMRRRAGLPSDHLFPNARSGKLSQDGVQYIINKYLGIAGKGCPSLMKKRVTPHVLRHTTAVHLLQAGVDQAVIALWLGHESVETTKDYVDTDLAFKRKVLAKAPHVQGKWKGYRPDDHLMKFLTSL